MERQIAYSLGKRQDEFLKKIIGEDFIYNALTSEITSGRLTEPLGIHVRLGTLIRSEKYVFVVIQNDPLHDAEAGRNERQRLRDLADKF